MLELTVVEAEGPTVLQFEHSLLSLSKWESIHKRPFLTRTNQDAMGLLEYYECMLVTPEVNTGIVYGLMPEQFDALANYISESQTATTVPSDESARNNEIITSELIYWWMASLQIPFQPCESWHLSRLMKLIEVGAFKSQPEDKRKKVDLRAKWREMSERNRARFNSEG